MSALPSRISTSDIAGRITATPARKPRVKIARRLKAELRVDNAIALRRWSLSGVVVMSGLSAWLNGLAFSEHATTPAVGWLLGGAVTAIVLILGKVASNWYRHGHRAGGKAVGVIGAGLLALSVYHVAASISAITGSPLALALPMAVAIDAGFVACEIAATVA